MPNTHRTPDTDLQQISTRNTHARNIIAGVRGADRLGIDHRGGRLGVTAGGGPDLGAQRVVQPGQGAVIAPAGGPGVRFPRATRPT